MGSVPGASSSTFFSKMAANMAAMQKNVAAKKLNSRILTQFFFYNICPTPRTSSSNLFFKMAANMAAMQKNVADLNAVWVQATPTSLYYLLIDF